MKRLLIAAALLLAAILPSGDSSRQAIAALQVNNLIGFASGGEGFQPSNVATALSWWFRSTEGVTQSGGTVSQWNDKSSNGRNVSESTNKPAYSASGGPNGYPVIQFDGSDEILASSTFSIAQPYHLFMVFSQDTWVDVQHIIDLKDDGNVSVLQLSASPNVAHGAGAANGNSVSISTGTYVLLEAYFSGASSFLKVNGSTTGSGTNIGTLGHDIIRFGGYPSGGQLADVNIVEACLYPAEITGTDLTNLREYFRGRYSLY